MKPRCDAGHTQHSGPGSPRSGLVQQITSLDAAITLCFMAVVIGAARVSSIVGHSMNHPDYSGELRCSAGLITYHSAGADWSVPVADVRLIGEYTNSDGPYLDDYFMVFLYPSVERAIGKNAAR